jgi:IS30 family transposase
VAVLSLTERVTRKKLYRLVPDLKSETVHASIWAILEGLPDHMRKSLTLDNGAEFAYSTLIALEKRYAGFKIYFCDPYAAWQKGSVENSNRDLRWYFPKGTDFSAVSKAKLAEVEGRLGRRPLKCLGYQMPDEVFTPKTAQAA